MLELIICANLGLEKIKGFGIFGKSNFELPHWNGWSPISSAALPRSLWYQIRTSANFVLDYEENDDSYEDGDNKTDDATAPAGNIGTAVSKQMAKQKRDRISSKL